MRRKNKSFYFFLTFIIIGLIWLPSNVLMAAKEEQSQNSSIHLDMSKSYILEDVRSKEVLLSENEAEKKAPASTTKLLTGLVALDYFSESDIIEVGNEVNIPGSHLGLVPGDKISVRELLTAMYLMSANDAAAALAVAAKGSIPNFSAAMNEYASNIGCQNSNFTNPHGLSDPNHYTTAKDLINIAKTFITNEKLMKYVRMKDSQVKWISKSGQNHSATIHNTNKLLEVYPGNQGLKTGTTEEAGQCLISYTTSSDGDLLLVLLGSNQRYADAVHLFDQAWSQIRPSAALVQSSNNLSALMNSPGFFP